MKGRVIGILALIVWGVIKLPIEEKHAIKMQSERLGGYKPTATLRQQAGQAGFIAALGGLRAAVADLMWIRAHTAWQDVQYGRMKLYFDVCTALQPRRELFWDVASWHMAWNGAAYVENARNSEEMGPMTKEERAEKMREFYRIGEDYLLQGIRNMPDSWVLYDRLGTLYRDKFNDPCRAAGAFAEAAKAGAFAEAAKRPGRLDYTRRFAVYMLADCPGHDQEAYEKLLALYHESQNEWLPGLLVRLQRLERKLDIPKEKRVYIPPEDRLPAE
jgi:hypothetical protein